MLLGLAIGDALGHTSESMAPSHRRREHGEIRDYLPNWHADNRRVGLPSDDTHHREINEVLAGQILKKMS